MTIPLAVSLILAVTFGLAAAEDAVKPPAADDSMAHVLKTESYYTLAEELGDPSAAGEREAASLQAAARRIQTEFRVASKSMRRVMVLNEWREALNRWNCLQLELVMFWSGGGTMYSQMMGGDAAVTEDFLAGIADHLPVAGKPLTKETAREIDGLLKKSKERLAQAKLQTKRMGVKPPPRVADLARRLEEAHSALKSQFQFAGDDATTQLLLHQCKEPTELWE